jgi:hypothetical protein
VTDDVLPLSFQDFQLNPDEVYLINANNGWKNRMDPLVNDSLKMNVKVSFSKPYHGKLSVEADGDTYYTIDENYIGPDSLTYTVCSTEKCKSEKMRLFIEAPLDPNNCTTVLGADSLETTKNTSASIRVFMNDIVCPVTGISFFAPVRGTFEMIQYPGSLKNYLYVYHPPKNYTGEDSFRYRVHPDPNNFDKVYLEMVVKVKVK